MNIINFNDKILIEILLKEVPEFEKEIISEFNSSAYLVYGDFGIFLRDKLLENDPNMDLIKRSFDLLNKLVESGDDRILQMLKVTIFEILTDYEVSIEKSKFYLKGKALVIFSDVIKFLNE